MPALPIDTDQIVITASRVPEEQAQTPASATIIDEKRIERLGEPLVPALLRLVPSAAVSISGPAGSLTDVRIRGAEANHTLLFVDGIRANDPATGDQPRFDLLNADMASRIEVVRGPQSALWGSDAIGGVVALNGAPAPGTDYSGAVEAGSFGFHRAAAAGSLASDNANLAAAVGWQGATGIDSFDGHGDKDGYRNLAGRVRGTWKPSSSVEFGVSAFGIAARSEFDGFDLLTFVHADTRDSSRNRLGAGRIWASFGDAAGLNGQIGVSLLGSSNRNFLDAEELNRTSGTRRIVDGRVSFPFTTGSIDHRLIAAAEAEHETFRARDTIYGGFTDQDRSRDHEALTLEWRGTTRQFTGDVAIRRDSFNRFKDATSLRASLLAHIGGGFSLAGSYAEGIAQPTFFDLYGFFPGSFTGNPSLKPESSRGFEASIRYRRGTLQAAFTGYRQKLHDEIVDNATFTSAINSSGTSRRQGVEADVDWKLRDTLHLSANYAYLDATQPGDVPGSRVTELRRPKHSGSVAVDGVTGKLTYGASLAYVGKHIDRRDVYPFDVLSLRSYWLAGMRVGYTVHPGMELFARAANALNSRYLDVSGYRTEGRSIYGGIRLSAPR